jgi:hypothetical protein
MAAACGRHVYFYLLRNRDQSEYCIIGLPLVICSTTAHALYMMGRAGPAPPGFNSQESPVVMSAVSLDPDTICTVLVDIDSGGEFSFGVPIVDDCGCRGEAEAP